MIRFLAVCFGAYATVVLQLGAQLFGGQPYLLVIGAVSLLVTGRPDLGFVWIAAGATVSDLWLSAPVGTTLIPLVFGYGILQLIARRFIDVVTVPVALGAVCSLVVLGELPLAVMTGGWQQLGVDLRATVLVAGPILLGLIRYARPVHTGLAVERTGRR